MLILARPHTSLLDGPAVALYLRKVGIRHAVFAVDPDYARHPVWSRLLNAYGWFAGGHTMRPLDAARPFALRELRRLLDQGRDVVLFPQGTGIGDPDRPDRPGVAWLLRTAMPETLQIWVDHKGWFPMVSKGEQHDL